MLTYVTLTERVRRHARQADYADQYGLNAVSKEALQLMSEDMLQIALVGDFDPSFAPHPATAQALELAASNAGLAVPIHWLSTTDAELLSAADLDGFSGYWIAPGSPYQSLTGALRVIEHARCNDKPLLGTCGGFQHVVLEYARNVMGFSDAAHAEYDPYASLLFVSRLQCSLAGKTLTIDLDPDSFVYSILNQPRIEESYYCNFGLNPEFQDRLQEHGLRIVGTDSSNEARIVELPEHRFFLATLFLPQLQAAQGRNHPLVSAFVSAAFEDHKQAL